MILPAAAAILPAVTVSWNPNPELGISGYILSYGTASGQYTTKTDVGNTIRTRVSGLEEGVTYYFVVRAYNESGFKSAPSDEMKYRGAINHAPNGWIGTPATNGTIVVGQTVNFTGTAADPDGDKQLTWRWSFGEGSGIAPSSAKNPGALQFNTPGTYQVTLTTTDSKGMADPIPDTRTITVVKEWSLAPQSGWTVKYVNSEQPDGNAANLAIDGNPGTFWHTQWKTPKPYSPTNEIQIDMKQARMVKGFQYLPRQDGYAVGDIVRYAFYVSNDGVNWSKALATGELGTSTSEKRVFSTPKRGRFIRLVSFSEATGGTNCNIAELRILEGPPPNRAPSASAGSAGTSQNKPVKLTLKGGDADGNPLSYQIKVRPKHGTLSGTPPKLTYTPAKGFSGSDSFTFFVGDGRANSKSATFKIRVKPTVAAAAGSSVSAASFATSAAGQSAAPVVGTETIGGLKYRTLTAAKPAAAQNVQVSPNLVDWFSGGKHVTVLADNERFLKVRDNTPLAPGTKRYIRLKTPRR